MKCKEKQKDYLRGIVRNGKLVLQFNNEIISVELPNASSGVSNIQYLELEVSSNNQILFPNAIPSGKTVLVISINGHLYYKDEDFTITNTTIGWIGDFSLITSDEIIMWVS